MSYRNLIVDTKDIHQSVPRVNKKTYLIALITGLSATAVITYAENNEIHNGQYNGSWHGAKNKIHTYSQLTMSPTNTSPEQYYWAEEQYGSQFFPPEGSHWTSIPTATAETNKSTIEGDKTNWERD